jgi:hypothetical protein
MYVEPTSIWTFGTWVNGGHWSTCEARMIMGYYRLGQHEDVRRSMRHLMTFVRQWRMDNPLTHFGSQVYQPHEPINLCYDTFGPAAAMIRGLFEYRYTADGLTLVPSIPPGITLLEQRFPIRLGRKQIWLSTAGNGPITRVRINSRPWADFTAEEIFLPYDRLPDVARVQIALGESDLPGEAEAAPDWLLFCSSAVADADLSALEPDRARLVEFLRRLNDAGFGDTYEAAHARLAFKCIHTLHRRRELLAEGHLEPLPDPAGPAAERMYVDTARKLVHGLEDVLSKPAPSGDERAARVRELWESQKVAK